MEPGRTINVLIAALGGQGGAVLADWLAAAAHHAGYPAQATSIPGVAQRTGATNYYFELFPSDAPAADPVFSLFPSAGDVNLVVALEPMEAARALQNGYVTKHTTVITASERIFAIGEKIVDSDGIVDTEAALRALEQTAARLVVLDLTKTAATAGSRANAVMLGAIAGSGVLPLAVDRYREAIAAAGVSVDASLSGFAVGLQAAADPPAYEHSGPAFEPTPDAFTVDVQGMPAEIRALVGHATARLLRYQDARYAKLYCERLHVVIAADQCAGGAAWRFMLSAVVARRLAAWMAFEDVIRVAQLKSQPGRLALIRRRMGANPEDPVLVRDYLSPGREELLGLLPAAFGGGGGRHEPPRGRHLALRFPTSSPAGFAMLKAFAALRPWRRRTARFAREQAMIKMWLDGVCMAVASDYELAVRLAEASRWARGYGAVRARGELRLKRVLSNLGERLRSDKAALVTELAATLADTRTNPDGNCRPA